MMRVSTSERIEPEVIRCRPQVLHVQNGFGGSWKDPPWDMSLFMLSG